MKAEEMKIRYRIEEMWPDESTTAVTYIVTLKQIEDGFLDDHYGKILSRDRWTGLHDKNGKEIYQKDKVSYFDDSNTKQVGTVEWCKDCCGFYAIADYGDDEGNQDIQLHKDYDIEVIGTVYDKEVE